MKLNIKIFEDVITTKTTLIKKIYYAFIKIKFVITIKSFLIRDFDI